jgi:hypothetical protein
MLAGRTIRVPLGSDPDQRPIVELLDRAGVAAEVRLEPATLEEAMVELSS